MHLAKNLKPVRPPAHVWTAIQRRLNYDPATPLRRTVGSRWQRASCSLPYTSLLYWRIVRQPGQKARVATISAKSGTPEIAGVRQADRLVARVMASGAPRNPTYELGPASGEKLPCRSASTRRSRVSSRTLTSMQLQALALDPSGRRHRTARRLSTGQPTGDVST